MTEQRDTFGIIAARLEKMLDRIERLERKVGIGEDETPDEHRAANQADERLRSDLERIRKSGGYPVSISRINGQAFELDEADVEYIKSLEVAE